MRSTIARCLFLIVLGLGLGGSSSAQILIKPSTGAATAPNTKAILDLDDVTRGILIPRVTSTTRPPNAAPVPANSLLIYQTDTNAVTGDPKGYYYWDALVPLANKWVHVSTGNGWRLGGNAGTTAANFIGTTNNQPMVLRANGVQSVYINSNAIGEVQIGTSGAPTDRLEVNGAMRLTGTSAVTATEGAIRFNAATGAHEGFVQNPLTPPQIQYTGWYQLENVFKTRAKQRYASVPVTACVYPVAAPPNAAVADVPAGATGGDWPLIDNPLIPNGNTAATTETPYSTYWEDGRHQYLYLSPELVNLNICPNTNVNGIAFQTASIPAGVSNIGFRNQKISMKNTTASTLVDFEYTGLQTCYTTPCSPAWLPVLGWNAHVFTTPWQWLGPGVNMLVEHCFDNQDWTYSASIYYDQVGYGAMYGLYCDACGHPTGANTCYYSGPCTPNGTPACGSTGGAGGGAGNVPGTWQPNPGVICVGWGYNGLSGGGCAWTTTTSLLTCDGTFQYQGTHTGNSRRPVLRINAQTNGQQISYPNANYLLAEDAVMIGDYAWATGGASCAQYQFKGPGTIAAQSSVWGGTVLLSDHVFDNYYDGVIKPEDAMSAKGYLHYPIKDMARYVEQERHLPTISGREQWKAEGNIFSLDQLTNQLWVTVEEQSLYIKELDERMDALQSYLVEKRLAETRKN